MMTAVLNAGILSTEAGMWLTDNIRGENSTGTFEQSYEKMKKCVEKNKRKS
ncbi:hypothetical protein SRRS_37870 [Sporomusa rhizae]